MTANGSTLVLVAVVAGYVVLGLVVLWGRHHRDDHARQWQLEHHELMRELEHHEQTDE